MDTEKREPEKQGPEKEYSFIQERIVPKRKNRVKRAAYSVITVTILAIIFGVAARYAFIYSGPWLNKLLGIPEEERQPVVIPSKTPDFEPGTLAPELTETEQPTSGLPTPTATDKELKEEEPEPPVQIIQQKIDATLEDYAKMSKELQMLAAQVNSSLVSVIAVEDGVDWMNEVFETSESTTGVIIGENNVDLLILTSFNLVKNADRLEVRFSSSLSLPATLWSIDEDYNLAMVAVNLKGIPESQCKLIKMAEFGESYTISAGTPIIALGNPNGHMGSMEIGQITSKGSGVYITDGKVELFNTNIADNTNSGGVIVNLKGEIIGIITNALREDLNSELSTAIGISRIRPLIEALANNSDRAYFGIQAEDIPSTHALVDIGIVNGIYVTEIKQDSPAFDAGIKSGDIIMAIGDTNTTSMYQFSNILANRHPKDVLEVKIKRIVKQVYKDIQVQVILGKKNR